MGWRSRWPALAAGLILLGCAPKTTFVGAYRPTPLQGGAPAVEDLVVRLGGDERPLQGRSSVASGLLVLIPLIPYASQQIGPERFTASLPDDVVSVIVADLRALGIAGTVLEENDPLPGQAMPEAPYALIVTVTEGTVRRNVTLYGLSFFGAVPWLLGVPIAYDKAELSIAVELRDPSDVSVGRASFRGEAGFAEGLYYNPIAPTSLARMARAYEQISGPLRDFVRKSLEAGGP